MTTVEGRPCLEVPDQRETHTDDPAQRRAARIGGARVALLRLAIVATVAFAAVAAVSAFGREYVFFDLKIYHGAVVWWTGGGELYQYVSEGQLSLGFTYPPFAALLMAPMAMISPGAAAVVNTVASLVALTLVLYWLLAPLAERYGWSVGFTVAVALPAAAATEPIRETLGFGQINVLLAALVCLDMVALRARARARAAGEPEAGKWAGIGIGLATAIKITPGLFIGYLLVTRQWRAALTAVGALFGAIGVGYLLARHETVRYFTDVLWQTGRVGEAHATPNQALSGMLARLYDAADAPGLLWFTFSLVVLVVGLSRAANAHREGDEVAAFTIVGLTANAVSPISWTHHLVFLIPAVVVLADLALSRRSWRHAVAAVAPFALLISRNVWSYEHVGVSHYSDGLIGVLMENSLALAILVLVTALPWRVGTDTVTNPTPAWRGLRAVTTHRAAQLAGAIRGS